MKISFHGAAQVVTGSKHLIQLNNGKKILLDCGLFQGMGEKTIELNRHFGFNPREVDYMILSHAHIDHSGLLPKLIKEGYRGPIYCTPATADLTKVLLLDSAAIQEADIAFVNKRRKEAGLEPLEPMYSMADANQVFPHFKQVPYGEVCQIDDDISFHYTDTGHILGSAAINLLINEDGKQTRITFSGDVGRYRDVILRSPEVFPQADHILLESTYGNSLHEDFIDADQALLGFIQETCIENRGKLIIPAFSVGRTQEILYALNKLETEGLLPDVPYFVDSPLSTKTTEIVKHHSELYNQNVIDLMRKDKDPFNFKGLEFITEASDSKALNKRKDPMVIISASGMAEAGRVKHHIANNIENPKNMILMVGFCEYHSLGARLMRGEETVKIFRQEFDVKAKIASIRSMSAHGDYDDLIQFLSCQNPKLVQKLFIVHGEYEVQQEFRERLIGNGFHEVIIPELHQTITL